MHRHAISVSHDSSCGGVVENCKEDLEEENKEVAQNELCVEVINVHVSPKTFLIDTTDKNSKNKRA